MSAPKQQVKDLLKSIETGDPKPAAVINPKKYIQHNPAFGSGRAPIVAAFGKNAPRPIPPDPKDWSTKIVAVTTQGKDIVCVASVSTRQDPRNPGQTYTTTHFDMWRFVDGKADEHWDEGTINVPGGQGKGKQ